MSANFAAMLAITEHYQLLTGRVDERLLRQLAGAEAKVLGCGGGTAVSRATNSALRYFPVAKPPGTPLRMMA